MRVPVTTVPKPVRVKTRSRGRRKSPVASRGGRAATASARASVNSGNPNPASTLISTRGEFSRKVPAVNFFRSSRTNSIQSDSAKSHLVRATRPLFRPSSRRISKCSLVWGMTPSSAATTRRAISMPAEPANMFLMKRSWPGTSTTPARRPPGRSRWAKPDSMVMPRSFS